MWVTGLANCSLLPKRDRAFPSLRSLKRVAVIGTRSADTLTPSCLATFRPARLVLSGEAMSRLRVSTS
jgi:hypothetical protein